jgi:Holliday junction resolvase RusA-like endonuclease
MMFSCFLDVIPTAKGRARFTRKGFAYTPEKTRAAENSMRNILSKAYKGIPLDVPLIMYAFFLVPKPKSVKREFPSVKPDLDNYIKALSDSANGIVWKDDSQVIQIHTAKLYGDTPGIVFGVDLFVTEDLHGLMPLLDHLAAHEGQGLGSAPSEGAFPAPGSDRTQ